MSDNPVNQSLGKAQPEQRPVKDADEVTLRVQEAVKQVLPDVLNSALSEFERRQQSLRDKMMHRIEQRFAEYSELLRSAGAEITPDMERKIRERAESEVRKEQQQSDGQDAGQAPAGQVAQQDVYSAAIAKILDSFGVSIEDSDPEAAIIASSKDASELLANVAKAARMKAERVSQQRQSAGGLPLTTGASPASNPLASLKTPDEIWEFAKQQLKGGK